MAFQSGWARGIGNADVALTARSLGSCIAHAFDNVAKIHHIQQKRDLFKMMYDYREKVF